MLISNRGLAIIKLAQLPEVGSTELLLYRITFSAPVPALHLVLSTGTDLELLLVSLDRYFLTVLLFCFTFRKFIHNWQHENSRISMNIRSRIINQREKCFLCVLDNSLPLQMQMVMMALRPNPKLACKEARRMVTSSVSVHATHAFRHVIVDHR